MVNYIDMRTDFNFIVDNYGEIFRIKYYTTSGAAAGYDDNVAVVQSGNNIWTSGMLFPFGTGPKSSSETVLVEQGKIRYDDSIIYFKGTLVMSGAAIKIGIGSPVTEEYQVLDLGVHNNIVNNQGVYKKTFVRLLNNGSFINEA